MITGMRNSPDKNDVELSLIRSRLNRAPPRIERAVTKLLQDGDLGKMFGALTERLKEKRQTYESMGALEASDKMVTKIHGSDDVGDPTHHRAMLRRPDRGAVSSEMEYWLLKLLPMHELEQIFKAFPEPADEIQGSGGLSVRNVIENVLGDEPRTRAFIEAVQTEVRKFGDRAINVYDVGCGPFPVLAIAAALASNKANITCIEINPRSAEIARRILKGLDETGLIRAGKIEVITADALTMPIDESAKIDVLISETIGPGLLDEKVSAILPRFAPQLSGDGVIIPPRARISATLTPTIYSKVMLEDDRRFRSEVKEHKARKGRGEESEEPIRKYHMVIDTASREHLVQPEEEWHLLTGQDGLDLSKGASVISGSIRLPKNMSLKELRDNYQLSIATELILDKEGTKILPRYHSMPTTPMPIGFIDVPASLMHEDPNNLEVYFEVALGGSSANWKTLMVRRTEIR